MSDFHHAQLVGSPAEIEEAEMRHKPAAHHLIGGHGGIEATGHQYQGLLQRTQRVAADAVMLLVHDEQALVADLHAHFDFRCFQRNTGGAALLAQLAANVALDVHGAERMLAGTLAAHGEDLARQALGVVRLASGDDVVEIAQRVLVHFQAMGDAGRAAQALDHLAQQLRLAAHGFHLDVVPHALDPQVGIELAQHGADVLRQLANEALAHRRALDGDFGENLDDQLHGNSAAPMWQEKRGAEYSGNCSTFNRFLQTQQNAPKECTLPASRTNTAHQSSAAATL